MRFEAKTFIDKKGSEITLRNAEPADAEAILKFLKTTNAETRFLICEPEEVTMTVEQDQAFINRKIEDERELLLVAFDGDKHIGNCSLMSVGSSVRYRHRCSVAIALYKEYCGRGIGRVMLETALDVARNLGCEQAELEVMTENEGAIALYESVGFVKCGFLPNSAKYKDGSYADSYWMVKEL